jgi:hypothetical protein
MNTPRTPELCEELCEELGALELDLDTAANEIASLCDRVRALIRRVEQLGEMAAAC